MEREAKKNAVSERFCGREYYLYQSLVQGREKSFKFEFWSGRFYVAVSHIYRRGLRIPKDYLSNPESLHLHLFTNEMSVISKCGLELVFRSALYTEGQTFRRPGRELGRGVLR